MTVSTKEITPPENLIMKNPSASENSANPTMATSAKSRDKVLLQTAVTYAQGDYSSKSIAVRALFDSGSQRTYITTSFKKRLGLVPLRTETLNLNTFGEDHYKKRKCDVVQLSLKGRDGS